MKTNKILNITIIIIFIATISLPQCLFNVFKHNSSEISNTENRKLKSKPNLTFSQIENYPKEFDEYYNDHLPLRDKLRTILSSIDYNFLSTSIDSNVIIGKDGWLFYRGDHTIEKLTGIKKYTVDDKENILTVLKNNINVLEEKNIKTYVIVIPDKENIYSEKLPSTIKKSNVTSSEELINYIQNNSDINIVYPKEYLLKTKEQYQVYRKYDTHWNMIGGFIGTICLQNAIIKHFDYDIDDIEYEKTNEIDKRDLSTFINLQDKLYENTIKVKNFYSNINCEINKTDIFEEYISDSKNNQTVLFIGDSFRTNMKDYFSKLYKRVVYVHRDKYNYNLIDEINPNIIVIETVERTCSQLGKDLINAQ